MVNCVDLLWAGTRKGARAPSSFVSSSSEREREETRRQRRHMPKPNSKWETEKTEKKIHENDDDDDDGDYVKRPKTKAEKSFRCCSVCVSAIAGVCFFWMYYFGMPQP